MPAVPPQNNVLDLRDIHLPEPISWWPPAPGWWILLGIVVLGFVAFIVFRNIQRNKRLKKAALSEFENIRTTYQNKKNPALLARSISTLLRRICLSYYPNTNVPGMTGQQGLCYLDSTTDIKGFQTDRGNILAKAPYVPEQNCPDFDAEALLSLSEAWIKNQPVKDRKK